MRRRLALSLVLSSTAMAVLVPAANAAELWQGHWETHHKFGHPSLQLVQDGRDVHGKYFDDEGKLKGKIHGTLSDHKDDWTGTFKDLDADYPGKFHVELNGDRVSFDGWFKTCGRFTCSSKHHWHGEHS